VGAVFLQPHCIGSHSGLRGRGLGLDTHALRFSNFSPIEVKTQSGHGFDRIPKAYDSRGAFALSAGCYTKNTFLPRFSPVVFTWPGFSFTHFMTEE